MGTRGARRTALCIAGVLALTVGTRVHAQPSGLARRAASARASADSTPSGVSWQFDQCMGGLTYGAPLKWALSYGMGLVRESPTSDWCLLTAAKVGLGGAGINVGVANSLGHFGSGASLTAGVLRTFNRPAGTALAERTYVGLSLHLWPILGLGGEIGVYSLVGSALEGSNRGSRLITWSTGFGF